jgi:general secretion pathway protein G
VQSDIELFKTSLLQYQMAANVMPTTEQGLEALLVRPEGIRNWRGPYAEQKELIDPWNRNYVYVQPGTHNAKGYDLYSVGPDGQPNTEDDIGNWDAPIK